MLPSLCEILEQSHAWLKFRVNHIEFGARIPVCIIKLPNPKLPSGKVYNIRQLTHLTELLQHARVEHWYKIDDSPTIMAAVSADNLLPAAQEQFASALLNAASDRPDMRVRLTLYHLLLHLSLLNKHILNFLLHTLV